MSDCTSCGNRPGLKCPLSSDLQINKFLTNAPLHGQVFGLPMASDEPPFFSKKLNDKEMREGIDNQELWLYVPSWQIPRIGLKPERIPYNELIRGPMPMKKIICMARKNKTLGGYIGELKFVFPHFGKRKVDKPSSTKTERRSKCLEVDKMKKKNRKIKK